jgi:hypothetical protein
MSTVQTKTISQLRNQLFSLAEEASITTVTRNGRFIGVLITENFPTDALASLTHKRIKENPVHSITQLTKELMP